MRVLVTGAFGFLGGRLAVSLRAAGLDVVVSGRTVPAWATALAGFETRLFDVLDLAAASNAMRGIDAVIHLASLDEREATTNPELALRVSGEGTRVMIEAARLAGVARLVFFSTFHVYGATPPSSIDERTPTRASHPYSISHLAGEGYCLQANLQRSPSCVVLRLSNGYGCPLDEHVDRWSLAHNDFCRQAVRDGRIVLKTPGLQQRDFVWVEDICEAVRLVLGVEAQSLGDAVFNVGGGKSVSILELAERVSARAGARQGRTIPIDRPAPPTSGSTFPPVDFSVARLASFGYVPRDGLDVETDKLLALLDARAQG